MSIEGDRRAPGATRIPFEALVEVSPSLGPSFEAQAVDVSDEGMHLRTAYLPEIGQPLLCRFDAGSAGTVNASGEVLWRQEGERGGEFGMRFVDLDQESADALGHIVRIAQPPDECDGAPVKAVQPSGAKVRLHIEGLGFPMRARVKDATRKELTVGNELGFLQVGKQLELEDAETGEKRPAAIDRVEVEIDPESRVPRLVVGLRYADEAESMPISPGRDEELHAEPPRDSTPEPSVMDSDEEEEAPAPAEVRASREEREADEESNQLKSAFARNAAKVTPAIMGFAKRAKATAGVLWAKRKQGAADAPQKRTTAPPPAGGLHAAGRKVVRAAELVAAPKPRLDTKRKIAIGAGAGLAVVLAFAALHKSPKTQTAQQDKPAASEATAAAAAPPPPPAMTEPAPLPVPNPPPQPVATAPAAPQEDVPEEQHHAKHVHVAPFGNGSVAHGNVLKLKMDGTIEKINGASEPDGFSVSIPGRRALEPAGPLASRDARLASIKVTNDQGGASLDVAFKDGVPRYLVRAKGDTLEIVLAAPGRIGGAEKSAEKPQPASHASAQAPRHRTHRR